jgi:uncharacterized surface protein with fasciclin (FAS1) repeats
MKLKFTLLSLVAVFAFSTAFAQQSKTPMDTKNGVGPLGNLSVAKAVNATLTASPGYLSGSTIDINFTLELTNTDFEYGDAFTLTFPAGFTINSVSNDDVFGPSFDDPDGTDGDPEPYNGIDGQSVSWGDDDNSYGGITPGNLYEFSVNVTVDGGTTGDQTISYEVSGDGFGAAPADFSGDVTISEVVVEMPIDFELPPSAYSITAFGDVVGEIIANPDPSGVNTSDNVFRQIQPNTPTNFGGAFVLLDNPLDFAGSTTIALDVWTPAAGVPVTLRFEDDPNANGIEETLTSTVGGAWETLVFDFAGDLDGFPDVDLIRAVVFFDLGQPNNDETYYMDNIRVQPLPTIFEIVEGSDVHETLEFALGASGLDAVTNNPDVDLTLFAPTDAAFAAIQEVVDELVLDPTGALTNVLLHHVLAGSVFSGDLSDGLQAQTLQGENITVNINGSDVSFTSGSGNTANLVVDAFDIQASNGVVHVIDAVLVPAFCTVFDGGPYIDFGAAPAAVDGICPFVVQTGFQAWASEGYIVTDFVEGTTYTFGLSGGDFGAWDPAFLVLDANTSAVIASETEGSSITWTCPADGDYIIVLHEEGTCGGQSDNLSTNNGFPYLTCESALTITDIVVASPAHNTLEAAVIAAGLDDDLAGEGPFTVFAPTDGAFDNLPAGLLDDVLADVDGLLIPILQHHVVPAVAYSSDLSDGQTVSTLNEDVTISIDGDGNVSVTSSFGETTALVLVADIIASNGVVHVVDAVLTPSVLSVDNLKAVESLGVYPNPTNNQFTVDITTNATERITIDIVNIVGQVVKSVDLGVRGTGMNREYIDVNDLTTGMYFMNITVGDDTGTVKVQIAR